MPFRLPLPGPPRPAAGPGLALLLGLALCAPGCSDKIDSAGPSSLSDELEANWDLWQSWTTADYEFDFQWSCFCLDELTAPVRVKVVAHGVTEVTYVGDGTPVHPDYLPVFPSIAQLFFTIESAIEDDVDVILVDFHEERGYPVSANLDYDVQVADDELAFTVDNVSLSEPAAYRARSVPALRGGGRPE